MGFSRNISAKRDYLHQHMNPWFDKMVKKNDTHLIERWEHLFHELSWKLLLPMGTNQPSAKKKIIIKFRALISMRKTLNRRRSILGDNLNIGWLLKKGIRAKKEDNYSLGAQNARRKLCCEFIKGVLENKNTTKGPKKHESTSRGIGLAHSAS